MELILAKCALESVFNELMVEDEKEGEITRNVMLTQAHQDREIARDAIAASRKQSLKVIDINLQSSLPGSAIDLCVTLIKSGERILITLPKAYTDPYDTGVIDDILHGYYPYTVDEKLKSLIPPDVFIFMRPKGDVIVCDIYHV